jgi:molecular chaperone DnaK
LGYGLGVDIGTSTISVATLHHGQTRTIVLRDGNGEPIGPQAAQTTGPASAVRALAASLRAVLDAAVDQMGDRPDTLVLTYPARQGRYGRDLMAEAARLAGLDGFAVISDLEAAAASYTSRERLVQGDRFVVYDLGAGAFSVAVAGVTAPGVTTLGPVEGVKGVGGADFDRLILTEVDRRLDGAVSALDLQQPVGARAMERVQQECELAKIQLSSQDGAVVNVLLPYAPARSSTRVRQSEVHLSAAAFEAMIVTSLESTLEVTHRALAAAEVAPEQLAGILLIGGSARIPLVAAVLSTSSGIPVHADAEPAHRVAHGAALLSAAIEPLVIADLSQVPDGPGFTGPAEFARPVPVWSDRLGLGPGHRRRALAAVAVAAVLLLGGVGYLVLGPDSTVVRASGGPAQVSEPATTTGGTGGSGPAPTSPSPVPTDADRPGGSTAPTSPTASRTRPAATEPANPSATVPSGPATGAPTAGSGTTRPSATGSASSSVPPTGSPTASATASPGLIITIGDHCYDLSRPVRGGGFAEVPCA